MAILKEIEEANKMLEQAVVMAKAQAELIEQGKQALIAKQAEIDAKQKEIEGVKVELAKANETAANEIMEHSKTKQEMEKVKKDLEIAQKALTNPAFAAAAVKGSKEGVAEGGSQAGTTLTYAEACAEYKKLTDPKAREAYRNAHAVELKLK